MLSALINLVVSLALVVLPMSDPCTCRGFTFFCDCASAQSDTEADTGVCPGGSCCHCKTQGQGKPAPSHPGTPCCDLHEIHQLTLLTPSPLAIYDVNVQTILPACWIHEALIVCMDSREQCVSVTMRVNPDTHPPPILEYLEPIRLLI